MKRYCLYTEDVHREMIIKIIGSQFDNFTVIPAIGVWSTRHLDVERQKERSLVIEIVAEADKANTVKVLARYICKMNQQEAVLITSEEVTSELVYIF